METKQKKDRTQEDVDKFNKAVNEYNEPVNSFNELNEELNKSRSVRLNDLNKSVELLFNSALAHL